MLYCLLKGDTVGERKVAYFIDDDRDFLRAVTDLIEHPDFDIQTCYATSGYRIVDEIIKARPNIIFIDFNLPRANGGQIVSVLRTIDQFKALPVYFITGYSKSAVCEFLKNLAFEGVLDKGDRFVEETLRILEYSSGPRSDLKDGNSNNSD